MRNTRWMAALLGLLCLTSTGLLAQGTAADYARAAALWETYRGKLQRMPEVHWLPSGDGVWWRSNGEAEIVRVQGDGVVRSRGPLPEQPAEEAGEPGEARGSRGRRTFFTRDGNLWRRLGEEKEQQLSFDGGEGDSYSSRVHVAPGGAHGLAFQSTRVEPRQVPLLESSPEDGLQPELHWMDYPKPGDGRTQRRPRLFDLRSGKQIPVADGLFAGTFRVSFERWSPDGKRAYLLVNERGHQRLRLVAVEVAGGSVRTIVDERSETFVDYSQKTVLRWLDASGQLLWGSERSGYQHLYRYDAATGELLGAVTSGPWMVRLVEHVDEAAGEVTFSAMGLAPDQDPYHIHLARAPLEGGDPVLLTEGDGTHRTDFSPSRSLFVDTWSRVDQPRVVELRGADGQLLAELGRDDATALYGAGYRAPERFVAKGRDGETDIYGIVIRPSNFDPASSYPVLERVYAGPHDFHVPKEWGTQIAQRRMAELGFVVVQIDGMGTNWRGKAFHDVCWRNLMDGGMPDRIAWIRAAAARFPGLDASRVGIYGGSAGGQNALAAMLNHGDFYSAAAADCGCHDNRMDKVWWNEAWMGRMGDHYADNSNVTHAHKLSGKLLLTVGELDRNVDPASTLQVVDALIRAGKDFDFVMVPGAGHGVGEGPYLFRRRQDFFVRALHRVEPRR